MTFKQMFTSSIGKKLVMGLTGLFLISFLIVHVSINACIFADLFNPEDNGQMFNKAAHFMGSTVLIRILEVGLMAGIVVQPQHGVVRHLAFTVLRFTLQPFLGTGPFYTCRPGYSGKL